MRTRIHRIPWMASAATIGALLLSSTACYTTSQGKTKVLDPDADDALGGTGTESGDIRTIAERMSREIAGIRWPEGGATPRIAVLPIDNQTRFRVDPKLLQNKLVKELVNNARGRFMFLARDSEQEVIAEREKKRAGMYDTGNSTAAMAGADYLLKGEMRALSKATREGNSDYIVYTFQLIEAETGGILWVGDYETKKAGSTGVVYQ
ncbi:MAG: CsgG/HfaB family protein [Pseudomonadota bacterium]